MVILSYIKIIRNIHIHYLPVSLLKKHFPSVSEMAQGRRSKFVYETEGKYFWYGPTKHGK